MKNRIKIVLWRYIGVVGTLLWLLGCQATDPAGLSTSHPSDGETSGSVDTDSSPPSRPFPEDVLYSMLKAEFAGLRNMPYVTLREYRHLARHTRDVQIVKRATRIAHFLNASEDIIANAGLWLELEPLNPDALDLVIAEHIKLGQLNEAFKLSVEMLEQGFQPQFQAIAINARKAQQESQQQLLESFQQQLALHPDNSHLLSGQALLLYYLGDTDNALSSANLALKADKNNTAIHVLKASLLEQLGQTDAAIKILGKRVKKEPNNKRLRLQYARLLVNTDLKKAQQQFFILVKASPFDADLILSLALICMELDENDAAKEYLEQLLFIQKHVSTAYFYLGQISEEAQEIDRALELYHRVSDGEEYLYAANALCSILIDKNRTTECQEYMQRERLRHSTEISNDSHNVKSTVSLALIARLYLIEADLIRKTNDLILELDVLNQGLEQFPNHHDLRYARSMVYEKVDNIAASEKDLRFILDQQPDSADALNALGYTLVNKTDRLQEGYELITRALALEPDNAAIIDSMGWALYRLNRAEEALTFLRRAMESFPNDEIAAHLGEVLWITGEQEEARKIWQQGLKDKPDSHFIKETLDRLSVQ